MAHLLALDNVSYSVPTHPLFADLTLGLEDGMRVGVVGRNGAGKSTLLRLLTGECAPDSGRVTRDSQVTVAHLTQGDATPGMSVRTALHGQADTHEWASSARIRDIHAGLLAGLDLDQPVAALSGGQRRRVAIARQLIEDADVLALDEPTNHLDVESVAWLADHLNARYAQSRGALVVVTHDRWFLDAVCTRMWEVVPGSAARRIPGSVETYDGGYAAYVLARAERARMRAQAEAKRQNLLRKELAWLRRGAPARTSKPKFRIEAATELIRNEPPPRDTVTLKAMASARLGKDVIDLKDVSFSYGEGPILDRVTWGLAPGERVGIVGANGTGKTTILALLAGTLTPTSGRVKRGSTVRVATLTQHTRELDEIPERRVVDAVNDVASHIAIGGKDVSAAQLVEQLGFTHDRAWTPVGELSGGERRRVQLVRLLMAEPNVLLLDEPTNDLDTDVLAAIEDLLDTWPGTLVVVSHDRYLLERLTDHQVALYGDGQVKDLPGGVDQYLAEVRRLSDRREGGSSGPAHPDREAVEATGRAAVSNAQMERERTKALQRIERQLDRLGRRIESAESELAEASADPSRVGDLPELSRALQALHDERDTLEEEWLLTAEQ
ncbi:MAG: ABC-F family ATP-binding cassette domain-containing protein [Bowdeniella nasicola]|nr:ABC-F family ATP-binding cassette domain-containing protein [Bowdeniella nasicola]